MVLRCVFSLLKSVLSAFAFLYVNAFSKLCRFRDLLSINTRDYEEAQKSVLLCWWVADVELPHASPEELPEPKKEKLLSQLALVKQQW